MGAHALDERRRELLPESGVDRRSRVALVRAVEKALRRLEADGWLAIEQGGGRGEDDVYQAELPETANDVRRFEWEKANERPSKGERRSVKGERRSPEDD